MGRIRVLIADDHPCVRKSLDEMLGTQQDMEVVGVAETGREALSQVLAKRPAVLLIDLSMPGIDGLEVVRQVRHSARQTRILVFSMNGEEGYIHRALFNGASGYVLKGDPTETLLEAIRHINLGEYFLSPGIDQLIIESLRKKPSEPNQPARP